MKTIILHENLKRLRKEFNHTQSDLAKLINVDQTAISKYERGIQFPELSTLIKICEVYSVGLDEIIYREMDTITDIDDLINFDIKISDGIMSKDEILTMIKFAKFICAN